MLKKKLFDLLKFCIWKFVKALNLYVSVLIKENFNYVFLKVYKCYLNIDFKGI